MNFFSKLSDIKTNSAITLYYLNSALNNPALVLHNYIHTPGAPIGGWLAMLSNPKAGPGAGYWDPPPGIGGAPYIGQPPGEGGG